MNTEEFYDTTVKPLPIPVRLRLAALILKDIAPHAIVDYSDDWSDEDLRDAARYSFERADEGLGSDA